MQKTALCRSSYKAYKSLITPKRPKHLPWSIFFRLPLWLLLNHIAFVLSWHYHLFHDISLFLFFANRGEENFHIFYYMYDGLAEEGRTSDYFLHAHSNCRAHRYLQGYNERSSSLANVQCFKRVKQGFQLLGFRQNVSLSIALLRHVCVSLYVCRCVTYFTFSPLSIDMITEHIETWSHTTLYMHILMSSSDLMKGLLTLRETKKCFETPPVLYASIMIRLLSRLLLSRWYKSFNSNYMYIWLVAYFNFQFPFIVLFCILFWLYRMSAIFVWYDVLGDRISLLNKI